MKLKIKKISIKNFFSVGAIPFEFEFTSGNHAVIGKVIGQDTSNGVGKSQAFIDAIIFAFKGISVRNLNKEQMINVINGSDCEVKLWFDLNGIKYRIERGMLPNFLRFINEDKDQIIEHEEEKSLPQAQTEIDKALGISKATLINIITQNINYSKPFFKLDAADRRQIMLDVTNTAIFGKMLERARKDYNSAKQDLKVLAAELKAAEENFKTNTDTLNKLEEHKKDFETNKINKINNINNNLKEIDDKIKELESSKILKTDFKNALSILLDSKEKRQKIVIETDSIISSNNKTIQLYINKTIRLKSTPVCSECNSPTTEGHALLHIKELEEKIKSLEEENVSKQETVKNISKQLTEIKEKTKNCETYLNKQTSIIKEIDALKNKKIYHCELLETTNEEKFSISNVITPENISAAKLRVDIKKSEIKEKDKQLLYADIARDRLGDKGIKSFSIKKIVPILNKKMNEYLSLFKADYTITFDNELKETLKSRRRDEFSYNNFSAGEQKRIDLALMFSLLSIAKSRSSVDCNILILDEILDSSLCADGISSLILFLKTEFRKLFPELCVYIISHKSELNESHFNTIVHLKKENNFTKLDKIQKCETILQL